jgi:uncharacterized protein YndB with AHSA1/START domain
MDRGSYVELDGRAAVRFERAYPHPVERVWAAVSTPEGLANWFPAKVAIDLRVGGEVKFTGDPFADDREGTVLACDPPRRLWFTWADNELRFDLEAAGAGGCRLTLVDVLSERQEAARNAAGWTVCLGELHKHISGEQADGPHSSTALPWQPIYDEYVAGGLPSGAEVPD